MSQNLGLLAQVKYELIEQIVHTLTTHYAQPMFTLWLASDAPDVFRLMYSSIYRDYFDDLLNEEKRNLIKLASKNMLYAMNTYLSCRLNKVQLNELLYFVNDFMLQQLDEINNDFQIGVSPNGGE